MPLRRPPRPTTTAPVAAAEPEAAVVRTAATHTAVLSPALAPVVSFADQLPLRRSAPRERLDVVPTPRPPAAVPATPGAQPGQVFLPGGATARAASATTATPRPARPAGQGPSPADSLGLALGLLNRGGGGLEAELHKVLPGGQLRLHYQVQRNLRTGALVSLEALIRWAHPEHGLLAPAAFLPVFEEAGAMGLVDTWALQRACQDGAWLATRGQAVEMAVNVTATQLTDPRFVSTVEEAMGRAGLAPGLLTLELGLRDVLTHIYAARDVALALRRRGVRVSVADVASGATGPARLAALQVGEVKADRALIRSLNDPSSGALQRLRELVAAAHEQDIRVVAEGVEDRDQFNAAYAAGCDRVQGFLLGWPAPLEDLAHVLAGPVPSAG